jgi:MarR family transcriptional regulator for hemolysin
LKGNGVVLFKTHIGFLVHDVSRKRRNYFDRTLRPIGLTRSQLVLLLHLETLPDGQGISQRNLAQEMQIGPVSLGELVTALVAQGGIDRQIDPGDRRQRILLLTAKGRDLIVQSRSLVERMNMEILEGIDRRLIEDAERALSLMQANLIRLGS